MFGWAFWIPGESFAGVILDTALKGMVFLLAIWVILRFALSSATASVRHTTCVLAAGGLLLLPFVSTFVPQWRIPLPKGASGILNGEKEKPTEAFVPPIMEGEDRSDESLAPRPLPVPPSPSFGSKEPVVPFPVAPVAAEQPARVFPEKAEAPVARNTEEVQAETRGNAPPPPAQATWDFQALKEKLPSVLVGVFWIWAGVAFLSFLPWVIGLVALCRLLIGSRRVEKGPWFRVLEETCSCMKMAVPRLYQTDLPLAPMAGSLFRPFIIVPSEAKLWSQAKMRNVLIHELGHIKRHDDLSYFPVRLVAALHWFNPLVWSLVRILRFERERACDDFVLSQGIASCDYAGHLVEIMKEMTSTHPAMSAATPMATPRWLEQRILAILDEKLNRKGLTMRNLITATALIGAVTLFIGAATITEISASPEKSAASSEQPVLSSEKPVKTSENVAEKPSPAPVPLTASAQEEIERHYKAVPKAVADFILRTEQQFGRNQMWFPENAFASMDADTREKTIKECEATLNEKPYSRALCFALAKASVLRDKRLMPGLLKTAGHTEEGNYDCRPKWIAVAALARMDDQSAVPVLVPLVDFGNLNVQMWSRAALYRLTGQTFDQDKKTWGAWWNAQNREPKLTEEDLKPFGVPAAQQPGEALVPAPGAAKVLIPGKYEKGKEWVGSGVELAKGDIVFVEAEGATTHRVGMGPYSPNGSAEMGLAKQYVSGFGEQLCNDAFVAALVGKVGEKGMSFLVGERRAIRAPEAGVLFLGFNEAYGTSEDNEGSFTAYVSKGEAQTPLQKCLKNRLLIREAKAEWAKANGKQPTDVPKWEDLVGPDKSLKEKPVCPEGGEYSLAAAEPEAVCSKHAETRWVAAPAQATPTAATPAAGAQATPGTAGSTAGAQASGTPAAPQEYTLPEGHVSAFGKDYPYAFLSGDSAGYKAPDYEGFFPDDEEAGKKLDDLLQNDAFNRTKWVDDNEVCRMVRQGLKRFKGKDNLMSWLGNQYIWGKSPQNPDAIEIAYHMYGNAQLRHNAEYFGLSVVAVKPPAILKTFVDLAMKGEGVDVGRMQWGAREQQTEILKYLEPYLKSDKPETVKTAERLRREFDQKLAKEQPIPEDEETQKKNQEKWKKEMEERKQAFFKMSDDERRQKIRGMNFLFGVGGENVEEDNKILDILAKYTKDSDAMVRRQLADEASNMYIWSTKGEQNPKAIAMALELGRDSDWEVRQKAIYFGLSTIRNKSEEVVRTLLDIAYQDREWNNYQRIVWGLRDDRTLAKKLLDADLTGFLNDPEKALNAFEVYGDLLEESPATTPDWVASMAAVSGKNEMSFYLSARDPRIQTDLPAFRAAVRDTLLKNKERGERWLKQFYLDKSYKTWAALVYVPFQDRYVFQDFIKANGTLVIQGFPGYVTAEQKAKRIENLRTPDLQPVKASDITPANAGETVKALPAEAQAVLDKKKAQLEAERKALMAPSELQIKVNAAKPGDTIRLEAKEYVGVVTIDKPLTLEGAENRATLLSAKTFPPTTSTQEQQTPALLKIQGEGPVVLRNLRFRLETPGNVSSVIRVNQVKVQIVECEIEKATGSGISIIDSEAEVQKCRVANLAGTGIAIGTKGNQNKLHVLVSDCELAECVHRGITIAPGCDNVTVEKCRISGSSWHGIRYDDASPKIVGNLIFKNSRCGIYASGKTKATVTGNVFENNGMTGISNWFNSSDVIEGNTFVGTKRGAIEILGYSAPTIRHNIFAGNESAISFGNVGQGDAQVENAGKPVIEANLFWDNKDKTIQVPPKDPNTAQKDEHGFPMMEKQELDAKSLTSDPKFMDAAGRNYGLQSDSPALAAGIGVKSHLPFEKAEPDAKKGQAVKNESDPKKENEKP